jgi:hypothetical protein
MGDDGVDAAAAATVVSAIAAPVISRAGRVEGMEQARLVVEGSVSDVVPSLRACTPNVIPLSGE